MAIAGLTQGDLPAIAGAVPELADCLALRRPPLSRAVDVISELASGSTGTVQLIMAGRAASRVAWDRAGPVPRRDRLRGARCARRPEEGGAGWQPHFMQPSRNLDPQRGQVGPSWLQPAKISTSLVAT
jgi:hypothetical protein